MTTECLIDRYFHSTNLCQYICSKALHSVSSLFWGQENVLDLICQKKKRLKQHLYHQLSGITRISPYTSPMWCKMIVVHYCGFEFWSQTGKKLELHSSPCEYMKLFYSCRGKARLICRAWLKPPLKCKWNSCFVSFQFSEQHTIDNSLSLFINSKADRRGEDIKKAKLTNDIYVNFEKIRSVWHIKVTWKQKLEFLLKMNNISCQNKTAVFN